MKEPFLKIESFSEGVKTTIEIENEEDFQTFVENVMSGIELIELLKQGETF